MKIISKTRSSSEIRRQLIFITLIMLTIFIGYTRQKHHQAVSHGKAVPSELHP